MASHGMLRRKMVEGAVAAAINCARPLLISALKTFAAPRTWMTLPEQMPELRRLACTTK